MLQLESSFDEHGKKNVRKKSIQWGETSVQVFSDCPVVVDIAEVDDLTLSPSGPTMKQAQQQDHTSEGSTGALDDLKINVDCTHTVLFEGYDVPDDLKPSESHIIDGFVDDDSSPEHPLDAEVGSEEEFLSQRTIENEEPAAALSTD